MKIGGLQKFSMIDYPGKISAVVFVQGCNFRCPYCHNRELVLPEYFSRSIDENEVLEFLSGRRGKLQGVVVTGGEPTIFPDLPDFLLKIKRMGFYVKLDTNGSNPYMLETIIDRKLVDYIAMDIKAPVEKYGEITASKIDKDKILSSIQLILQSGIEYEFRTTVIKDVISYVDILKICNTIKGASRYAIQNFHPAETLVNEEYRSKTGYSPTELSQLEEKIKDKFKEVVIRT
ncbi:anaerobic ribonucleoside-triphosphate reductase activating protein [Persephonella sp.]